MRRARGEGQRQHLQAVAQQGQFLHPPRPQLAGEVVHERLVGHEEGLSIKGRSSDAGCHHGVRAVLLSVARAAHHRCRFLQPNGRLAKRRRCSRPILLRLHRTRSWQLVMDIDLPKGKYLVIARAVDLAGNREKPGGRNRATVRVRR